MASKVHTDDPKHHVWVSVNKRERKKNRIKPLKVLSLLFKRWIHADYEGGVYKIRITSSTWSIPTGVKVIYDDCNHKSFRVLKKRKGLNSGYTFIRQYGYKPRHFKNWRQFIEYLMYNH